MRERMLAPSMAGMERKKEYFTAKLLSKPQQSPQEMVVPDRERPGTVAQGLAQANQQRIAHCGVPLTFMAVIQPVAEVENEARNQQGAADKMVLL